MTEVNATAWSLLLAATEARKSGHSPGHGVTERIRAVTVDPLYGTCYAGLVEAMAAGPFVIGQMGQSLDGRIATDSGDSFYINDAEGLDHLHRLRSLVDAVVVGAKTVMRDDPRLTVRRVPGRNPVRVILDPRGRIKDHARVLADREAKTVIVSAPDAPASEQGGVSRLTIRTKDGCMAPDAILRGLSGLGLNAILVEGGPVTLSRFVEAGVVDRLHLLVAPLLLGSGRSGLNLPSIARIQDAYRPGIRRYDLGNDCLIDCEMHQVQDTRAEGRLQPAS